MLIVATLVATAWLAVPSPRPQSQSQSQAESEARESAGFEPRTLIRTSDYEIGPDDILRISVLDHDNLSLSVLVQSDGGFIFPLVGRIQAQDLTPRQLEARLAEALAQGLIRDPQVTVTIEEFRSKTVLVMGEVTHPGPYPLSGSMRIVDVLAAAGMHSGAAQEVIIIRPRMPGGGPVPDVTSHTDAAIEEPDAHILKVDIHAIQGGDLDQNIRLQPGDKIFVPPAPKYYALGEVRSPGAYTITPGMTIREAITVAGGFTEDASQGRTRVIRALGGEKKEIKIDLDALVREGDTIVVKGSFF
jgi:polysaccharide export outer membrane protein